MGCVEGGEGRLEDSLISAKAHKLRKWNIHHLLLERKSPICLYHLLDEDDMIFMIKNCVPEEIFKIFYENFFLYRVPFTCGMSPPSFVWPQPVTKHWVQTPKSNLGEHTGLTRLL